MYLSTKDFAIISNAIDLLINDSRFLKLPQHEQTEVLKAMQSLNKMRNKQNEQNIKTYATIKEKRKTDKNYGRTPYIKIKDRIK